jgi:hypothetical protein
MLAASALPVLAEQPRGANGPLRPGRTVPARTAGRPDSGPHAQVRFDIDRVQLRENAGGRGVTPTLDYWATPMPLKSDTPLAVELCEAGPDSLVKIGETWQCVGKPPRVYLSDTWTVYVSTKNHENLSKMSAVIGSGPKGPPPPGSYLIMWKLDSTTNIWSTPFTVCRPSAAVCP